MNITLPLVALLLINIELNAVVFVPLKIIAPPIPGCEVVLMAELFVNVQFIIARVLLLFTTPP